MKVADNYACFTSTKADKWLRELRKRFRIFPRCFFFIFFHRQFVLLEQHISPVICKCFKYGRFQGPYSQTILKNIPLSFSSRFVNLNITQLLIGETVQFRQSEVVLLSKASNYRKICRTRQRTVL